MDVRGWWMRFHALDIGLHTHGAGVHIVDRNRAARAEHLQRVVTCARRVGHRHGRARTPIEPKQHGRCVLHLTLENDIRRQPNRLPNGAAEQIEQHLDSMAAEIHHRPSAGYGRLQQPGTRMIRAWIEVLEGVQLGEHRLPDFAGRDDLLHAHDRRIEPAVVRDAEGHAMRAARRDHAIAFGSGHRHRLLAEHVLARLGGGNRLRRVKGHRCGDVDALDVSVCDEILPLPVPSPRPHLRREGGRQLAARAGDRNELAVRRLDQRRRHAFTNDVASADQGPAQGRYRHTVGCLA